MDESVDPCDNFYKFACGGFQRHAIISDDNLETEAMVILENQIRDQLQKILSQASPPDELKAIKLAKTMYKICLNRAGDGKNNSLKPLLKILKNLGGWPVLEEDNWNEENFNWLDTVRKINEAGYINGYLIRVEVIPVDKNTKNIIRMHHVPHEYSFNDIKREEIYRNMVNRAVILGANRDRAEREFKDVALFHEKLNRLSINEKLYARIPLDAVADPRAPFKKFVKSLLPSHVDVKDNEEIIIQDIFYFCLLEGLLNNTSKRVLANYLMFNVVADSLEYMSDEILDVDWENHKDYIYNITLREQRWRRCINIIILNMPLITDMLYVRNYFNEDKKQNVVEILERIMGQFRIIVQNVDWLGNKSRKYALDKLNGIKSFVGYADELLTIDNKLAEYYKDLVLNENSPLECVLSLNRFLAEKSTRNLRGPVDTITPLHYLPAANVEANYRIFENKIVIPAGISQGLYYNQDQPQYMNYAGIGYIIGHEIAHAFNMWGGNFNNSYSNWLSDSDTGKFLSRRQCIIDQYGNYTIDDKVGLKVNGTLTQNENIADNSGIKAAYLAYKNWVKHNGPEPTLPDLPFTPMQIFWINFANTRCIRFREEVLSDIFAYDPKHSPDEFRLIGTVSNMPEFSEDFKCPVGSKMNPNTKCSVW